MQAERELQQSGGDYLISAAGSYVVMGLSLILTIMLTRMLGAAGYGQLALLLAIGQTAAYFTSFWTTAGLVRFGSEAWLSSTDAFHRVFWGRNAMVFPLLLVLAAAIGMAGSRGAEWLGLHPAETAAVLAYVFATVLFQTSQFTFQALKRVRVFAGWQVLEKACLVAAVWVVAAHLADGVSQLVWLYAATSAAVGLLSMLWLGRKQWWPIRSDWSTMVRLAQFSWPLLLSLTFGYLSTNWIDLLIIRRYASLAEVGHYNLAYQVIGMVQTLPTLSFPILLPLLVGWQVGGRQESIQLYLGRLVPHACVALCGILVVLLALLRTIFPLVFGAAFVASVIPCGWLLVAVSCYGVFISGMPLLNLWEQTRAIFLASAAAGVVNVAGDLLFVPRFGINGAAVATFLAYATSAVLVMRSVACRLAVPWQPLLLSVGAVLATCIGCVVLRGAASCVAGLGVALTLLTAAVGTGRLFGPREFGWLRAQYLPRSVQRSNVAAS